MVTTLYDHRGSPIRTQELKGESQTSRVGHLPREFGDHPSRGLTPAKLARILEEAEQGDLTAQARLGEDMEEKDAHLYAELSKRRRAVLGVDWRLEPPREASASEKADTERIEGMLRDMEWETIVYDAAAAILHGYSCQEIEWDRSGGEWRPLCVHYRPPDWFMTALEARDELRLRTMDGQGELLRPWGWVTHIHKAKSGYLVRAGLSRVLAWPFLFRNYSARDMAEFLEIYGLPLRLGKYPPGTNDHEKATLMRAVVSIGHAAAGIIPEGMDIEFHEAAKGASDPYTAMIEWAERSISKAILGGTLTSQTSQQGGGAYALGAVHNEVRHDILVSDLRQIAKTMTRCLAVPLVRLNTTMPRMPQWQFDDREVEDIGAYSEALPKLVGVGFSIPRWWGHKKLGIPEAEGDEPVLATAMPTFDAALKGRLAAATAATRPVGDDEVDAQARRLAREAEIPLADMVETIRAIVHDATSLQDLRDRLSVAWGEIDPSRLADVMAEALAAAHMAGRYDILEEL